MAAVVPEERLELSFLAELAPKASVYTNFTTRADNSKNNKK